MSQAARQSERDWHRLLPLAELAASGVRLCRLDGRQIAVFETADGVRACDNRCPHEGYPLVEGKLSGKCTLTCNWHNWKFDLDSGDNLFGGDRLRVYPTEIRAGDIWIDLTDPPFAERYRQIRANLRDAFDDYSYDRIAREIARLIRLGADPLDAPRLAIGWSWQRLEFGWTHAYAGMADWLELYAERAGDDEAQLVCLVEAVAHVARDVLREPDYPFPERLRDYDADALVAAIEAEDMAAATALLRGGLAAGFGVADFEPALARAALVHYQDFGHAAIYVSKIGVLVERLGDGVLEGLLLTLVRGLVYARREDLIPEFRGYAASRALWGAGDRPPQAGHWRGLGIDKSLKNTLASSAAEPRALYHALLLANAVNLLQFDTARQQRIHVPVSGNVGWLDFTHGLTFANAVRKLCARYPALWPDALLQMACFNGRNAAHTLAESQLAEWAPADPEATLDELIERVLDHGQGEHIVSVHLLKTALAVREEITGLPRDDAVLLVAALRRFFDSPLKRRHARRTAWQALQFVARE